MQKNDHATSMDNKKIKIAAINHLRGIASVWVVAGGSSAGGATLYLKKNGYNMYMDGYETSQAFQRDIIYSIWASNDQVMTLGS